MDPHLDTLPTADESPMSDEALKTVSGGDAGAQPDQAGIASILAWEQDCAQQAALTEKVSAMGAASWY